MMLPAMRPIFRQMVDLPLEHVAQTVQTVLNERRGIVVGSVAGGVVELYPTREHRHLFSPRLSIVLYPREQTLIVGRYGPNPDVWTFFVAIYALCSFSILAAIMGSASQWLAGVAISAWIGIPVGLMGAVLVYATALVGRHLAREQVAVLETFLHECLSRAHGGGAKADGQEGA
jgi:hypothetical protein